MKGNISSGLRTILLVYAVLLALYGLPHLIVPDALGTDSAANRLVGAAAFAFGAAWAWLDRAWERVRIVVDMQVAWTVLYALALLWEIAIGGGLTELLPPLGIMAVFAVLFIFYYFREGRMVEQQLAHG